MNKCMASVNGVCQNIYACGLKCNGYSEKCRLRPAYNSLEKACRAATESLRRTFGIVGDCENE